MEAKHRLILIPSIMWASKRNARAAEYINCLSLARSNRYIRNEVFACDYSGVLAQFDEILLAYTLFTLALTPVNRGTKAADMLAITIAIVQSIYSIHTLFILH